MKERTPGGGGVRASGSINNVVFDWGERASGSINNVVFDLIDAGRVIDKCDETRDVCHGGWPCEGAGAGGQRGGSFNVCVQQSTRKPPARRAV